MPLIVPKRGLLYPGGVKPGFDPTHIAARGGPVRFSSVGMQSILHPKLPTITNAAAPRVGPLGPSIFIPPAGGTIDYVTFSGLPTTVMPNVTIACIAYANSVDVLNFILPVTVGQSYPTYISLTSNIYGRPSLATYSWSYADLGASGPIIPKKTPFFMAASLSCAAGLTNYVLVTLTTGQIYQWNDVTGITGATPSSDGKIDLGCRAGDTDAMDGYLAAVMYSEGYMRPADLYQWALDPWSFWYPRKKLFRVAAAAGAASIPNKVYQKNYAVKRASYH